MKLDLLPPGLLAGRGIRDETGIERAAYRLRESRCR